jgi:ABC-type Mn2+/Zn2+ transport system ATPase subunit
MVKRLTVTLGNRPVLNNVSFALAPCDVCGLIGANGSNKNVLMRNSLGLERKSAGREIVKGGIGYLPQKFALYPEFSLHACHFAALGLDDDRFGLPFPTRPCRAGGGDAR